MLFKKSKSLVGLDIGSSAVKLVELKDGPHGVLWTHADRVNSELVSFLA